MKRKIVHFIGSFHQGGSERQALQLARMLKLDGQYEVFIATLNKNGPLLEEAIDAGFSKIPEYKLNSFFGIGMLKQLLRCRRFLRRNEIDIVHSHDFYTNVFGMFAARLAGVPVRIASKRETKGIRKPGQERLERIAYGYSNAITVNSKAVEKHLVEGGVGIEKIHLIHNALDFDRFEPEVRDRSEICRILGIPEDKRLVTLVANLRHGIKNQPMLLRCAQFLREEFPDVHFVFAGEGERKGFLVGLAEKLGVADVCHFIDRCRIIPELLSVSEIGVLTSYAEGFSNSILEYMAAARPVVATDVGGARECVVDGESGFLVPSDNSSAMSEKLRILLNDRDMAKRFGNKGRELAVGGFSVEIQLQEVNSLYAGLPG